MPAGRQGHAHLLGGAPRPPSRRGCRPWPAASPRPRPRCPCRGRRARSSGAGAGRAAGAREAAGWGRLAAPAGSAPAPAPCHRGRLQGHGAGDGGHVCASSPELTQCPSNSCPPHQSSTAEPQTRDRQGSARSQAWVQHPPATPKVERGPQKERAPGRGTARPQQVRLRCHFSPLMWIDFSSPSSSTSTRSRPFSIILQTDR